MGSRGWKIRRVIAVLAVAVMPALAVAAPACRDDTVYLRGAWGEARFAVAIADTEQERARGLMFVRQMPRGSGMLFVYERPKTARFWMKNTLIPLDILFADASGTIRRIARMARPMSEALIPGGDGIQYVLEINGGMAKALGISAGSEMRHPAIAPEIAAWPCQGADNPAAE